VRTRVSYLPQSVTAREESRRRMLLLSIGALTLLSTSPVFGHHLAQGADQAFLHDVDHIGQLCLVALHLLLAPVHGLFHFLLIGGLAYASWDRFHAWWRTRRVLEPLDAGLPIPGDVFWTAAVDAGIDPRAVRVVDGLPNPAFTVGWLRPRVYVARQLSQRLSRAELVAVLAHEGAQVMRRDPLRLSVLRFFALTLFWIPALKRLADDVADEAEIQADDRAAGSDPLVLASAILAVAEWTPRRASVPGAVGFTRHDILERRVRRLAGEDTASRTHVTWRSLVGAAAALVLVWTSGVVVVHPLPGQTTHSAREHTGAVEGRPDCTTHDGPALVHLFCEGRALGAAQHRCLHADA